MPELISNELAPEFLGVVGLNPFAGYNSASRLAMYCGHIGQHLVSEGATVNRLITGVGREYGKAIHDVRFPCNATVLKVIAKYPTVLGEDKIRENPLLTVIYENADSPLREIGVLQIPRWHCIHQYFGFNYRHTQDMSKIFYPHARIEKDTVIATSPNLTDDGDHMFGMGMQVAMMSMPAVIEDGVIASQSAVRRMTSKGYGERVVSWGRNAMPLNLFGDDKTYKPFPDIGERVSDNGLLFASRRSEPGLAVPLMSRKALRRLDVFDEPVYAKANAKIIDVVVLRGKDKSYLPTGMDEQCQYYYRRSYQYHEAILAEYNRLKREADKYGNVLSISPEFNQLVVNAIAVTNEKDRRLITPMYGRGALDEWMVKIVFEYDVVPTIGFKITGMSGDKGVIVSVWDDEAMPVDAMGNRAELIMDSDSTIKRMNVGRLYEQYINASGYATAYRLKQMVAAGATLEQCWDYVMGFYQRISPPMVDNIMEVIRTDRDKQKHLDGLMRNGFYLYLPTNNPVSYREVVRELQQDYPACHGPVTYRGYRGNMVTTKTPVIIGEMYIMLLEKIGNTWAAVSSAKTQIFGIPAKLTNSDKHSAPGRHNPVRVLGESEVRLVAAVCGGDTVAEILDQTNNPMAHRDIVENILRAEHPTALYTAVDRQKVPRGRGRILTLVRHILECGGVRFTTGENNGV